MYFTKISFRATSRVARWFVFKPKIQSWEKFSRPQIGKCWYILWPYGIFDGYLGYFVNIRYMLCSVGTFFPVLVSCTKKNLATLVQAYIFVGSSDKRAFFNGLSCVQEKYVGTNCVVDAKFLPRHLFKKTDLWKSQMIYIHTLVHMKGIKYAGMHVTHHSNTLKRFGRSQLHLKVKKSLFFLKQNTFCFSCAQP
jgi:hypothetical protein